MSENKAYVISSYGYIDKHINYGALLQYYALEKSLQKLNIQCEWIRFCPKEKMSKIQKFKEIVKRVFFYNTNTKLKEIRRDFKEFLKCYCNVSEKVYVDYDELIGCIDAEIYITGSDQVWGGIAKENYLCFVPDNKRKISYAASFGKANISQKQKDIIKPWLQRLDYISVREKSGVKICNDIGLDAKWVLDPTLLLDKKEYPINSHKNKIVDVYCYFLNIESKDDVYWNKIKQFIDQEKLSMQIACVESTIRLFPTNYVTIDKVEMWLSSYKNAKYILTNTFHGMVFAIIFHKPFLVLKQSRTGEKQNERMYSILSLLNLENRFYSENCTIKEQINRKIDWNKVDNIIEKQKKDSIEYIKMALGDLKNR